MSKMAFKQALKDGQEKKRVVFSKIASDLRLKETSVRSWFSRGKMPINVAIEMADYLELETRGEVELLREYSAEAFRGPDTTSILACFPGGLEVVSGPLSRSIPRPIQVAAQVPTTFGLSLELLDRLCATAYSNREPSVDVAIEVATGSLINTMGVKHFWVASSQSIEPDMLVSSAFDPGAFGPEFIDAIHRKMVLAIIIPTTARVAHLQKHFRLGGIMPTKLLLDRFEVFRSRCIQRLSAESVSSPESHVDRYLQIFETDDFICTPILSIVSLIGEGLAPGNAVSRVLWRRPAHNDKGGLLAPHNRDQLAALHSFAGVVMRDAQARIDQDLAGRTDESDPTIRALKCRLHFTKTLLRRMRGESAQ